MNTPAFSSSAFAAYAAAIRQRESSNDYGVVNSLGYMGAYQMGQSALTDAGFQDANGNWTPLAKSLGVNTKKTFLSTPSAQDIAFQNFTKKNFDYLHNFQSYVGKTVGGVSITESGLLAGAHLTGQASVKDFPRSDGKTIRTDANYIPVTQYTKQLSGYGFTFPRDSSGFSPAVDAPPGAQPPTSKTPAEKAREIANQARADAAKISAFQICRCMTWP